MSKNPNLSSADRVGGRHLDPELKWLDHPHADDFGEGRDHDGPDPRIKALVGEGAFLVDELPGPSRDGGEGTRERGRVREEGDCRLEAIFAFGVERMRTNGSYVDEGVIRWDRLRPEFGMPIFGRLHARIRVLDLAPEPGTLTVSVRRDGPGPALADSTRTASGTRAQILATFASQAAIVIAPPDIAAGEPPITETFTATVVWHPDSHAEPCPSMVESIRVRWYRGRSSRFELIMPTAVGDTDGTHARTGKTPEPWPAESGEKRVVPTEIFWAVDDPKGCCGGTSGYSVIQFVRHGWELNERPAKTDREPWNLDILPSEVPTAAGEVYDPRFTHDPQGSDPKADPVVYPIPSGAHDTAMLQVDKPGLPVALYRRFLDAGGTFARQFHTLLVCTIEGGLASDYLANGRVEQEMVWQVSWVFEGGGDPPEVQSSKRPGYPTSHRRCKALSEVLDDEKLRSAYDTPRSHEIAIPR